MIEDPASDIIDYAFSAATKYLWLYENRLSRNTTSTMLTQKMINKVDLSLPSMSVKYVALGQGTHLIRYSQK